MSIFSSLLGAGTSLLGSKIASGQRQNAANSALQASSPYDVSGVFGRAEFDDGDLNLRLNKNLNTGFNRATAIGNRDLRDLNSVNFQQREADELQRLQQLRSPQIADARSALQSKLLSRGRIGLGQGGGMSGGIFNPESAALEEAIMRTQLGDIGAARQFSQNERGFLLNSARGAFGLAGSIGELPNRYAGLGITAGRNANPGIAAAPGFARADATSGFFSALGNSIPDLFGGGGSPGLPPGARPNGLGGLFL